jgi:hypothetical protein
MNAVGTFSQQPSSSPAPTKLAAAPPAAAAAAAAAAAPGPLLPAATARGPLITTSPEESAQAQQALNLLNSYDFKIYVSLRRCLFVMVCVPQCMADLSVQAVPFCTCTGPCCMQCIVALRLECGKQLLAPLLHEWG